MLLLLPTCAGLSPHNERFSRTIYSATIHHGFSKLAFHIRLNQHPAFDGLGGAYLSKRLGTQVTTYRLVPRPILFGIPCTWNG